MLFNADSKKEIIELTKSLIKIRSSYFNEEEAIEFVHEWLLENGLNPTIHSYHDKKVTGFKGKNVIGRIEGSSVGPVILLNGHLDTVNICEGWTKDPFEPLIENEKLYGLGSLDMKSGVAAFMMALKLFKQNHKNFKGEILYSFVSDEEGPYGLGTNFLIHEGLLDKAQLAIVSEPSAGFTAVPFPCLCLGARGGYSYKIILKGKSAHAANPDKGINAIVEASKLILELKNMELKTDPKLGKGDICIIGINGGGEACSVAENCEISIFRHIVKGESKQTIIDEINKSAEKASIKSEYEIVFRPAPTPDSDGFMPYTVDENNEFVKIFESVVREELNEKLNFSYFQSIGDFNYLGSRLKIPTLVFGPDGDNYHSADEYVIIEDIYRTAQVILKYFEKLLIP
jgi:succinyl-diaminopimelate desuccinylase